MSMFSLFWQAPQEKSVGETVEDAHRKRRVDERRLERERKRLETEISQLRTQLSTHAANNERMQGKLVLARLESCKKSIEKIDRAKSINALTTQRLNDARIVESAARMQSVNANAMHRINRVVSADRMRGPAERLTDEVNVFDETDKEIQELSEDLAGVLASGVEDEAVTDEKWEAYLAMRAEDLDIGSPAVADAPDELEQAIQSVLAANASTST
jgi:hypothetical protein